MVNNKEVWVMVKRDIDSGRRDTLGRAIKVSGADGASVDAKVGQLGKNVPSLDFKDAVDMIDHPENYPGREDEIAALKEKRNEYIYNLDTDDLMEIAREAHSYNGSLEHLSFTENESYELDEFFQGENALMDFHRAASNGNYDVSKDYFTIEDGLLYSYDESEVHEMLMDNAEDIYDEWEYAIKDDDDDYYNKYKWM